MATAFADQFFRPVPAGLRRPPAALKPAGTFLLLRRPPAGPVTRSAGPRRRRGCAAKSESVEKVGADLKDLVEFLYADLPHLFDEQGIDRTMYDDRVRFRDPITRHDTIDGYLFNIRLLKLLFRPDFYLHHVRQVDQLPHSATIVSDAGEPTSATQVDPEAQLPPPSPPPPPTDDHPANFLEKVVPVVLQLGLSAGMVALGCLS